MEMGRVLEGVRVVGFAWQAAGALSDRDLAHLGAEVIRVESSNKPDIQRTILFKDNIPGENRAALFNQWNTGKYGISLNMRHPKGVRIAKQLVARADVVTENFTAEVLESWGLGYEELKKIKPDIIMIRMGMMGMTGPQRKFRGWGQHLTPLSGVGDLLGWPDRKPCGSPHAYTDPTGAHFGALGVLAALAYRQRTGKGQYIDMAQREATVYTINDSFLDYTVNKRELTRTGNRSAYQSAAPHGAYRCLGEDRWCVIAVFSDEEWQNFSDVIGDPPWTKDKKFSTMPGRINNLDELDKVVEEWTVNYSPEEVMVRMQARGVAAGVVKNGRDLHEDVQLKHRQHFRTVNHMEIGDYQSSTPAFKLSKTPAEVTMPAPCFGQHNEYVMTQILGMSDEEFVQLLGEGVFE